MFGYVIPNCKTLSEEQRQRFRALYCGMCKTLLQRYGNLGRMTLSYDMTFVALLLSALYEPEEAQGFERCPPHPLRAHSYALTPLMEYTADLNIALAYHKLADNWKDDRNPASAAGAVALRRAYRFAQRQQPEKCAAIEEWMAGIGRIEAQNIEEIDFPANLTGRMLGKLFQYREDCWAEALYQLGDGLGRFIYFMDAYDDLRSDVRRKRYNPLKPLMDQTGFETLCKDALTLMMADCADAFEILPVVKDAELIRNILYSGVWSKYDSIQLKKAKSKGVQ